MCPDGSAGRPCRIRTVSINSMSKTYSVTGWRVGWTVAPPGVAESIRKVHDFLTLVSPGAVAGCGAAALALPRELLSKQLAKAYRERRDRLIPVLEETGFRCFRPRGAYYVMTDISGFGYPNDVAFTEHLVRELGVAVVPGSSFYRDPRDGAQQVRFAFCKKTGDAGCRGGEAAAVAQGKLAEWPACQTIAFSRIAPPRSANMNKSCDIDPQDSGVYCAQV